MHATERDIHHMMVQHAVLAMLLVSIGTEHIVIIELMGQLLFFVMFAKPNIARNVCNMINAISVTVKAIPLVMNTDKAHINMSEQIKEHQVEKTYIALVRGIVKENEASISMPIGRSDKDRKKMAVKKNGKGAITHFKVLERFPKHNCTLLEIKIETGRTHQIRVHLSHIGYPVIGDEVYSSGKNEWNVKGQCLHAKSLKFRHPISNKEMFLEAKIPDYLKNIIEDMEQEGQAPFVSKI